MKKEINLLLIGFLCFIIGLITLGFELINFNYVNYLPKYFNKNYERFALSIDKNKKYEILKSKYNNNIQINKIVNNSLKDEIYIEIEHIDTSIANMNFKNEKDTKKITFNNDIKLTDDNLGDLYNLVIDSIINKKMYNYNLLKYSKVYIYGNEEILSKLDIKNAYEN